MKRETTLESVALGGCIFLCGYAVLVTALLMDNSVVLALGAAVFLLGFAFVRKFDPVIRRSCAASGLIHLLLAGFIAACIFWNAGLMVRIILLMLSPTGLAVGVLASGLGNELRKLKTYTKRAYRQIKRQSRI